ncbi:MAG: GTPase HflX [Treponema sp.]|nr:GTPase HflX [Treponema sp.]
MEEKTIQAFLVGIRDEKMSEAEADSLTNELSSLVDTLELEIISVNIVRIRGNQSRYGMGTGKAEELAESAVDMKADCIIFDRELSPSQQRNWENLAGIPVIDRQELIIRIFASRARTKEAELQVNLAELVYALPRLQHKYLNLARQRGGSYGSRGSGETFFERDRRRVEERIHKLKEELSDLGQRRQVQRKMRERQGVPVCALVGYTNSGKSSLLNTLTGAEVLSENKLFATLDPTSRRLQLPLGMQVILVDTVGFIRRLPHSLVNSFRSTLEEASCASLLLIVLDASDPDINKQYETTLSVLRELGAGDIPAIVVLNKVDLLGSPELPDLESLQNHYQGSIAVSAISGAGLKELCNLMENTLSGERKTFRFPSARTDLAAYLHREGQVISENYEEDCILVEAKVDEDIAGRLKEYIVHSISTT